MIDEERKGGGGEREIGREGRRLGLKYEESHY